MTSPSATASARPSPSVVDVVVVGDGPAGSALAAALVAAGVPTVLVGRGAAWVATYGTWTDSVPALLEDDAALWTSVSDSIDVAFDGGRRTLDRSYGVLDNEALRSVLRRDVDHVHAEVQRVEGVSGDLMVRLDGLDDIRTRLVVDATGWPGSALARGATSAAAWQTAFGVVLGDRPDGPLGRPALMDWSTPARPLLRGPATFLYALPVSAGWLLEETVLASREPVEPDVLADVLASRLDTSVDDLLGRAIHVERVRIPMGTPTVGVAIEGVVPFGAAAGSVHPATGYSVADSLASARRVADAIASSLSGEDLDDRAVRSVERALWSPTRLRARALHDYGLEVLLSLEPEETRSFFATFFELDDRRWPAYLDADVSAASLSRTMLAMFRRAPWSLRRKMVQLRGLLATAGSVARPVPTRAPHTRRR